MKVLTFSQKVTLSTNHGEHQTNLICNPGERLLFDDDNALSIQSNPSSAAYVLEVSDLAPMLAEIPRPMHWKKKRVLFYRNRGVGDQLIVSALSKFFREVLGADARQLCERVHEQFWAYNPNIAGVPISAPMHLDAVWRHRPARPFFDGAFFIESVSEWDTDGEQPNVYDRLYAICGLDPDRIPVRFKRPAFTLYADDIEKREAWLKAASDATNCDLVKGYVIVQLRAANKGRSIPYHIGRRVLQAASQVAEKKSLHVLISDDQPLPPEIAEMAQKLPRVINVATKTPGVRLFGSLIGGARAVIGPDSSALHFAAAFETPAVGLWGPFAPDSRVKYYPNQTHLWHPEKCPSAPCYNYLPSLPVQKCPRGQHQLSCEVFEGITETELYSAILEVLA